MFYKLESPEGGVGKDFIVYFLPWSSSGYFLVFTFQLFLSFCLEKFWNVCSVVIGQVVIIYYFCILDYCAGTGDVAQWQSSCLAYMKLWILPPALQKKQKTKTTFQVC